MHANPVFKIIAVFSLYKNVIAWRTLWLKCENNAVKKKVEWPMTITTEFPVVLLRHKIPD